MPSDAWRNTYDAWKLATPPWYDEEDEEAREDAEAHAFDLAENHWSNERGRDDA